ncbi:Flp pilus assembly protein CpaB [Nocardioides sp.]|jgi:pilus assembly protein CpaB|uniref:Flp pilus assembly protein CpaB n=1 Tax=Nocardioides sp. TaxID=35761 RepID=UPI002F40EB45
MDRRRLLLILAVFVAVMGTALVFLYVQGADKRANNKFDNVSVLKATQDIAAGENYDQALTAGKISLQPVPQNQLTSGYQTTTTALKGKIASVPIFAGQQIIESQFGNTVAATSSTLAIPKGMIAISVNLTDPDRVAGNIQNGSAVAIFVTGQLTNGTTGASTGGDIQSTRLLLPKVTVLNVGSPQPPTTSTSTDESGVQTTETLPRTLLTIAVSQKDAQKVIVASKALDLTFGLLTPDSNVKSAAGTSTLVQSLFGK